MSLLNKSEIENIRTSLKNEMQRHLPKWRLLAKYISPHRIKEDTTIVDGRRKDMAIINNQAGRSLRTFQSGMMDGATPRNKPWFNLVSSNPSRKKTSSIQRYYSDTEKVVNNHLQLSNFYRVMPLTYKDVGTFSNSAFAMLPDAKHGFYFYPFTIGTYAYACDRKGRTNMFARDFTMTVQQVVETYGSMTPSGHIVWDNIPLSVRVDWNAALYLKQVILSQVVVPNATYNPTIASPFAHDKKFQSYTWMKGTVGNGVPIQNPVGTREIFQPNETTRELGGIHKEPMFIKVSGYSYFPVITPRWEVEAEGFYGVDGPGEVALSDILTLQDQEKFRFEGIEKLVRPPMVGHSSLRRHASSILAGGITYVDERGMQHGFKPAFELNPQLSELIGSKEEIQGYISSAFYEDLFRQISSEKKISHVTEAEINQRKSEALSSLAPILGQWDFDTTGPVIGNAQIILQEAGRLPKKPKELEDDELIAEYISTLAQAAKASLIAGQERFIGFLSQTSQALNDPTLLLLANGEENVRQWAENAGLNPALVSDETEYAAAKKAAQEAQAIAVQNEQQAQNAQTAKTMSETPVGTGSALDQI